LTEPGTVCLLARLSSRHHNDPELAMPAPATVSTASLSRRAVLILALSAASCASEPEAPAISQSFAPLDFSYLLPLPLNVASIEIEQRYIPSGVPPDVAPLDPVQPVAALRRMAEQRLKAEGTSGRAVFVINDASLIRQDDLVTGTMSVELDIIGASGRREGYAQATVVRQLAGAEGNLSAALYQFTRQMMEQMNVEFEYQVRHALAAWLLPEGAVPPPVQEAPLPPEGASPPVPVGPPGIASPESGLPEPGAPVPLAPPLPMAPPPATD
jgi:hypothetical protein